MNSSELISSGLIPFGYRHVQPPELKITTETPNDFDEKINTFFAFHPDWASPTVKAVEAIYKNAADDFQKYGKSHRDLPYKRFSINFNFKPNSFVLTITKNPPLADQLKDFREYEDLINNSSVFKI